MGSLILGLRTGFDVQHVDGGHYEALGLAGVLGVYVCAFREETRPDFFYLAGFWIISIAIGVLELFQESSVYPLC